MPPRAKKSNLSPMMKRCTVSTGKAIQKTIPHLEQAGVSLAQWVTTDHTGFSQALLKMPALGFWDSCLKITLRFIFAVVGCALSGLLVFLMVTLGIPFLITGGPP
ncbi:hypothetical protein KI614_11620 [Dechloromonas denitrificans]|uniref:hypothetical protein n=1 Tax=Dechloromonas denitrificans TaxID=281362 RepID=UPI001CF8B5C8|nr:hypothetical protein [Dechloromonas denitrificans]UCV10823.1 hypothetical protein KI614_11620 [Dechloromonas denitrificans]